MIVTYSKIDSVAMRAFTVYRSLFVSVCVFATIYLMMIIFKMTREASPIPSAATNTRVHPYIDYQFIPHAIYMTAKSESHVAQDVKASWFYQNPKYGYKIYNDSEAEAFVKLYMSKAVYDTYLSMPTPVLKADYFRYIVIYVLGGVYADSDTLCLKPVSSWSNGIANLSGIVSIEYFNINDHRTCEESTFATNTQFVQWTLMMRPGHPILKSVIDKIRDHTPAMLSKKTWTNCDILNWTGPGIWSQAIMETLEIDRTKVDGSKPFQVKDILILPRIAFDASDVDYHYEGKVKHLFSGSWKSS